jgi:hypothetical protein
MNGRSQMQGSLVGNLEKLLFPLYGTEWRERGYGVGGRRHEDSELNNPVLALIRLFSFFKSKQCSSPQ